MTKSGNGAGVAWKLTKEKILFFSGLAVGTAGLFHETYLIPSPRPFLVFIFVGMMGFTSLLKLDALLKQMGIRITLSKTDDTPEPVEDGGAP